jgi:hypothetical protein
MATYKIILPKDKEYLRKEEGLADTFTADTEVRAESIMRSLKARVPDVSFKITK